MKKRTVNLSYRAGTVATVLLLCVFPLFILNGYHDITAAKYGFFCIVTAFMGAICAITYVLTCDKQRLLRALPMTVTDLCLCLFLFVAVFSCLSSQYRLAALSGSGGRNMGLVMTIAMVAAYFLISRFYLLRTREFLIFGVSLFLMCLFSFLQFLGYDPLLFLSTVAVNKRDMYIGFQGNVNVFAGYLCISVPVFMYLFCAQAEKKRAAVWFIITFAGFLGFIMTNSDGGVLGLLAAFYLVLLAGFGSKRKLTRALLLCANFFFALFFMWAFCLLFKETCRHHSVTYAFLLRPAVFLTGLLLSLACTIVVHRLPLQAETLRKGRKLWLLLAACGAVVIAAVVLYFTVIDKTTDLGSLEQFLRFNDAWGTDRGFLWKRLLKIYHEYPFFKKLIGYGEDTIAFALYGKYGTGLVQSIGYAFDNAHNELLQYLLTLGAWGLLSYLGAVVSAVHACRGEVSPLKKAAAIGICVYLVQSVVNIIQPITTPLLFVFLGLTQCKCAAPATEENESEAEIPEERRNSHEKEASD